MKNALLLTALCLLSAPAMAQDNNGVIKLPGNAQVVPGNGNDGQIILRGYDTDDLIYRRLINPNYGRAQNRVRTVPNNDAANICGRVQRSGEQRRCLEDIQDLDKDRAELYRKYNN